MTSLNAIWAYLSVWVMVGGSSSDELAGVGCCGG